MNGIRLGYIRTAKGLEPLNYGRGSHVVALGTTGCGKFTTLLAQVLARWDGSLFVIDP